MARNNWGIGENCLFNEPIQTPSGIDDAYLLRFSTPVLILSSGRKYVNSYIESVFRLLPNTNSAYAYYFQTNRFLNYLFYSLKISQIDDIKYRHIQKFIKHYWDKKPDYGNSTVYSAIRVMFAKFRHDGLISDISYAKYENSIDQIKRNKVRDVRINEQWFERCPEHDVYDIFDKVLDNPIASDILDFRTNAFVAILLYLDLKVGEVGKLKFSNLVVNKLGEKYIVYFKGEDKWIVKFCPKSARHLELYLERCIVENPESSLFQRYTPSLSPTGRPLKVRSANKNVKRFCARNMIEIYSSRDISKSRRYVSEDEYFKTLDGLNA